MSCDSDCTTLVAIPGPRGPTGPAAADGSDGLNAVTTVTASFTMPACSGSVSVEVESSAGLPVGSTVYVESAGYMRLLSKPDATHLLLSNLCLTDNAPIGTVIPAAGLVTTAGREGVDGSAGTNGTNGTNGQNAFTVTTANFTQPAESATVTVAVASSLMFASGQYLFVEGGGTYLVTAIPTGASITLQNVENTAGGLYPGNAAPGAVVGTGSRVASAGQQGPAGAAGTPGAAAIGIINYFRADKNGVAQNVVTGGVGTVITFGTERFDNGSVYDPATSTWTCPLAGYYQFDVQVTVVAGNDTLQLLKNGGFGVGTDIAGVIVSGDFYLKITTGPLLFAAGDTVIVFHYRSSGAGSAITATPPATWFSGFRLAAS